MKFKKLISYLLAATMTLAALPQTATAEPAPQKAGVLTSGDTGIYNDFEYEELEDGTLSITGYVGRDTEIVIPDKIEGKKVTVIGDNAFSGNDSITKITISDGVTTIGNSAFNGCLSLTEISFPDSLTKIEDWAFCACFSLAEISLPDSLTTIGSWAFYGCSLLTEITIPENVMEIWELAFGSCENLTAIHVDKNNKKFQDIDGVLFSKDVKTIFKYPEGRTDLSYAVPNGVTTIAAFAFDETVLSEIIVPESVATIEGTAIVSCYDLKNIHVNKNNQNFKDIDGILFTKDETAILKLPTGRTDVSYTVPNGVTRIGNGAFEDCFSLEEIILPNSLTVIDDFAFEHCDQLSEIILPYGLKKIGRLAFWNCDSLTEIALPDGLESIGSSTFENCASLTKIVIPASVTEIGDDAFIYCPNNLVIYGYIGSCAENYAYANGIKFSYLDALSGNSLVEGVDYTVEYVYDLDAMCTDMIFTGIGNFTGKHTVYSYSTANPLCSFENGASDFAFDDVLERWRMDFSIADQSVWSKVDRIEAVIFSEGGFVNGCIGYNDMSGKWQKADFERQYGSYGYYTFSAKNVGGLISGPDEYGNEMGNLCFQLWWIEKYTNFYLTSLTLYDKEGKVLVRLPELKNYLVYETDKNNEVSVLGASLASETEPEIPAEIGGNTVTSIGDKAFAGKSGLASVTIPLTVTQIAKNAFDGRSEQFAIRGYVDSYAKTYADENNIPFIPIKDLSDKDHGVGLEDTEELIPDGAELVVEEVKSSEDGQTTVYDITLVDGSGAEVEPDGDVLVIIDLPQKWANVDKVYVYYCTENGTLVDMNAYISNGYIMFTTSHFSQYMLTTEKQTTVKLGDVDGNGKINSVDARWVLQAISGKRTLTAEQQAAADVNNDGKINTTDAKWILQDVSGKRELE